MTKVNVQAHVAALEASHGPRGLVAAGSVRVGALMALPAVLDELGADTDALLAAQGWRRADFEDPESVIPVRVLGRLLRRGVATTGCDHLGLVVGSRASLSGLGVLGFLMQASPSVLDALQTLQRYLHVNDRAAVVSIAMIDGHCRLGYALVVPDVEAQEQIYALVGMVGLQVMRGLCGPQWRAREYHLPFRAPANAPRLRAAFAAPLHFGAHQLELVFPAADLARPVPTADHLLHRMMSERVAELESRAPRGLADDVRQQLRTLVLTADCTPGIVAQRLGLPLRTLNRRLAEQGTSVRALRDEVRLDTASQLLAHGERSAADVAQLLGYAEPAVFTRAFRRWTGLAPMQWRVRQTAGARATAEGGGRARRR